ncbi:MAG: hypothetical protein FJX56_04390 [Alphaproteobacteria bacterium]|nr:hypothetical protein [Alphaproteobacteria bacterium]
MPPENFAELGDKEQDTFSRSQEILETICGKAPAGFRAPGYSLSVHTLGHLAGLGFEYDASF